MVATPERVYSWIQLIFTLTRLSLCGTLDKVFSCARSSVDQSIWFPCPPSGGPARSTCPRGETDITFGFGPKSLGSIPGEGTSIAGEGSEGRGFESLRAHQYQTFLTMWYTL